MWAMIPAASASPRTLIIVLNLSLESEIVMVSCFGSLDTSYAFITAVISADGQFHCFYELTSLEMVIRSLAQGSHYLLICSVGFSSLFGAHCTVLLYTYMAYVCHTYNPTHACWFSTWKGLKQQINTAFMTQFLWWSPVLWPDLEAGAANVLIQ